MHNFITGNEGCVKFNSNIIQNHNIFQIEQDLIIDKKNKNLINSNQCALLKCDQWVKENRQKLIENIETKHKNAVESLNKLIKKREEELE